jgi:hypothetical protein
MGETRDIRSMPPLRRAGELKIHGFHGTILASCPCGNPVPMLVPVIPGSGLGAQCNQCGIQWVPSKIDYREPQRQPGQEIPDGEMVAKISIGLEPVVPDIIVPKGQLLRG